MISMITAKIGTPRMKAAKFRWSCAIAQTASREPINGKARYAGSLAASWAAAGSAVAASSRAATGTAARTACRTTWRPLTLAPGLELNSDVGRGPGGGQGARVPGLPVDRLSARRLGDRAA